MFLLAGILQNCFHLGSYIRKAQVIKSPIFFGLIKRLVQNNLFYSLVLLRFPEINIYWRLFPNQRIPVLRDQFEITSGNENIRILLALLWWYYMHVPFQSCLFPTPWRNENLLSCTSGSVEWTARGAWIAQFSGTNRRPSIVL